VEFVVMGHLALWHYKEHLPPFHDGCYSSLYLEFEHSVNVVIVPWKLYIRQTSYEIELRHWRAESYWMLDVGSAEEWHELKSELDRIYDEFFTANPVWGPLESGEAIVRGFRQVGACYNRARKLAALFHHYFRSKEIFWCTALVGQSGGAHAVVKVVSRTWGSDGRIDFNDELFDPWLSPRFAAGLVRRAIEEIGNIW